MEDTKQETQTVTCPFSGSCDFIALADRVSRLEARIVMMADNLSGFAVQHQRLHGQLTSTIEQQGRLVQQLVKAAQGVGGTDWAGLFGEEIPGVRKITKRAWKILASGAAVLATAVGLAQYVKG